MILRGFFKKEIKQTLRNPIMVFALLFMPVVQAFLLSYAITNEPKNISIAISASPDDYLLNRIYEHAMASSWFVKTKSDSYKAFNLVQSGKANVVIIAPKGGFTRNLLRNDERQQANFQVLIDASNVIKAQSASAYVKQIAHAVLKEELAKRPGNIPRAVALNLNSRIMFNPEMNTQIFIVPAVMAMVVCSTILSLVCISIAREKEMGTIETLISAPIKKTHIILGKIFPAVIVALFNFISIVLLGLLFFKVPFRGRIDMLLEAFFAFCFAMSAIGVFLSTFCGNQQQALLSIMMTLFVSMMLSGAMAPVETMPVILKGISYVNPLTHFTFLTRNILLKGCNYCYFIKHIWPILACGFIFTLFGVKRFKQTL
jgi:ABC-2 type transport system permease protein